MKAVDLNTRLIDSYIGLLKNLSSVTKLNLISKLKRSLQTNGKGNNFEKAFGAWDKNESAEQLITSIKSSRTFNRSSEEL